MAEKKCFRKKKTEGEQRTVGIIGAGRSVGVTHFAVMAAGYASGVLREKCAVLEWNSHGDLARLGRVCLEKEADKLSEPFTVLEVDYYRKAGTKELLWCKTSGYQTVFVDYGALEEGNAEEFFRCSRQFVVGSLSEWQMEAFLEFAGRRNRAKRSWEAFAVFGSEETRKNMEKMLGLSLRRIPVSVDAFTLTGEILLFFQGLL